MSARLTFLCGLALVLAVASCGDGDKSRGDGGVEGLVTIGPTCPAVQQGTSCPDEPFAATIVILDAEGENVTAVESDKEGRFRVALGAGGYTLVPQSPKPGAPPSADELDVEVREGTYTQVVIQFDSGIR